MSAVSKYDRCSDFEEGLAAICIDNKYGFINEDGNEVIPLIYDYAYDFCEGYAIVGVNNKYGAIDKNNFLFIF